MAAVRILTGINPGDPAALIPPSKWRALVRERKTECNRSLRTDCRQLLFYIDDAAKHAWLGFADRDQYIRNGLGLDLQMVEWAVDGLRQLDGAHAIPFDEAVVLGKHGGKRERGKQADNVGLDYGNDRRSTLARLRRDRPELAQQVINGKLTANAAAIQAGFRVRTVALPLDFDRARKVLRRHFTPAQLRRFADDE